MQKFSCVADGSAAPVRLFGLLTYRVHRMLIRATRRWATALEMARVRVVVGLWRLYFETGHCLGDFLIARMTGHGRVQPNCGSDSSPETCHSSALRDKNFECVVKDGLWPPV
jgi:hypothetical protein